MLVVTWHFWVPGKLSEGKGVWAPEHFLDNLPVSSLPWLHGIEYKQPRFWYKTWLKRWLILFDFGLEHFKGRIQIFQLLRVLIWLPSTEMHLCCHGIMSHA
eukprot:2581058-Rhodomonas_salina.3